MSCPRNTDLQVFRRQRKLGSGTQKRIEGRTRRFGLSYTEKAIEITKLDAFIDRENVEQEA